MLVSDCRAIQISLIAFTQVHNIQHCCWPVAILPVSSNIKNTYRSLKHRIEPLLDIL